MLARYITPEMAAVWADETRFGRWRDIELAVIDARVSLGLTSPNELHLARNAPTPTPAQVEQAERVAQHDVVAFLLAWTAGMDPSAASHVHRDLTSSDVVDTALAMALADSAKLIQDAGCELVLSLCSRAKSLKEVACVARTHGQAAAFDVMGHRFADFAFALDRGLERLRASSAQVSLLKLSGPVGTGVRLPSRLVDHVANALALTLPKATTQVVFRDGIAAWVSDLGLIGAICESVATDVRIGRHDGVNELYEPASAGQEGSSAMPHKQNPILAENVTGLARLLRSYVAPALENIALWQHRDLTHSSVERVILPDAAAAAETILRRTARMLDALEVDQQQVQANIERTGAVLASSLLRSRFLASGSTFQEVPDQVRRLLAAGQVSAADLTEAEDEVLQSEQLATVFEHVAALQGRYAGLSAHGHT